MYALEVVEAVKLDGQHCNITNKHISNCRILPAKERRTDGVSSRTREIDWGPDSDILFGHRNVCHHLVDLPVGFFFGFLRQGSFVELRQRCVRRGQFP